MRHLVMVSFLSGLLGCHTAEERAAEPLEETVTAAAPSSNAVDVDPDTHRVELENDYVRVIRYRAPAGYQSNLHTHEGGAYVALTSSKSRTRLESGETIEGESRPGDAGVFFEFAGMKHQTTNLGETEVEEVLVELKVLEGATPREPPSQDAVEVDPDHHEVEFENELLRLVRMTYPEGYVTPPHNHYPGVNVLVSDVRAASGPEGEEVEPVESPAGTAAWADAGEPHVTRNLGGDMQLVRVEIKVR